jgi:hypothetical protein
MQESGRKRYFKVVHFVLATIWFILAIANLGKMQQCYNSRFGPYVSYSLFKWFEILYMFLGHLLLGLLYQFFNLWAYVIFEAVLVFIILIYLKIYISC